MFLIIPIRRLLLLLLQPVLEWRVPWQHLLRRQGKKHGVHGLRRHRRLLRMFQRLYHDERPVLRHWPHCDEEGRLEWSSVGSIYMRPMQQLLGCQRVRDV